MSDKAADPSTVDSPAIRVTQTVQDVQPHIPTIFKWLRTEKQVKSILKVVVEDDQSSPCQDEAIEKALENLDVRYLDWNKTDLCSETIFAAAPKVKELWLYSSGNNAVLRGWAQTDGLGKLSNVCAYYGPFVQEKTCTGIKTRSIQTDNHSHS